MTISVRCPHCKQVSQVHAEGGELQLRCPLCREIFVVRVPAAAPVAAPASANVDEHGFQVKAPTGAAPPALEMRPEPAIELPPRRRVERSRRRDEDFTDSSSNVGLIVGLSIGGGILFLTVVIALALVFLGRNEPPALVANQDRPPIAPPPPAFDPNNFGAPAPPQGPVLDPTRPEHFDAMLDELKSDNEDRRHRAYQWLKQANPNHKRRAEVTKILEERVAMYRAKTFGDDQFFDAYFAWATSDNYPWLNNMARNEEFTVWGNQRRHRSMQVLAQLKDERGVEAIAGNLESIHHRDQASKALVAMGSVAEKGLMPILVNGNHEVRIHVARVLAVIGTRASLGALEKAAQLHARDGNFLQEIDNARAAIQGREK